MLFSSGIELTYKGQAVKMEFRYPIKIDTIQTAVDRICLSFISRHDGSSAYIKPMYDFFIENANKRDLVNEWKVSGFKLQRNAGTRANGLIVVTVKTNNDDTARSIGKHIASAFTDFICLQTQNPHYNKKEKFVFHRDITEDNPAPLSEYLRDKDVVDIFNRIIIIDNKDELFDDVNAKLLESFFGSVDNARRLLRDVD